MKECCSVRSKPSSPLIFDKIKLYQPLIVIVLVSLLGAVGLSLSGQCFMNMAMGLFLSSLATLKLYSLRNFADSFSKYDVVAGHFKIYGLIYPFIELSLAFLYFSGFFPMITNVLMIIVMLIGTIGVIKTIHSGAAVQCACVGTSFGLPVGRVTLAENGFMILMAVMNLVAF